VSNRVALLTNIPAPYRLPFFNELDRYCDLLLIFDAPSEPNRKWAISESQLGVRHTFMKGFSIPYMRKRPDLSVDEERYLQVRYNILPTLYAFRPSAVVSFEMGPRSLQAAAYCGVTNTPLVIESEGTRHTEAAVSRIRLLTRRLLVKRAQRFWTSGRDSTTLLLDYGASPDTIDEGINPYETRFFALETRKLLPQRAHIRSELGLVGITFLFVGQYIRRKGLAYYLEALHALHSTGLRGWSAVFVGSGPLESALRSWQLEHPDIPVLINNFVQRHELPKFYAAADVFVLPSLEEIWGAVALEALAAGLPQLFSPYAGNTTDLLHDERLGRIVDPLKVQEFATALSDCVQNPPPRLTDELVQPFVDYYSPEQTAIRAWESISKLLT
jgi:glycosyltransferase involved in cell wall biosynthesis